MTFTTLLSDLLHQLTALQYPLPTVSTTKTHWCSVGATTDAALFIQCTPAFQEKKGEFHTTQRSLMLREETFSFLVTLPKKMYCIKHS